MILRSVVIGVLVWAGNVAWAQSAIQPQDRLIEEITESDTVVLPGNVHPALAGAVGAALVDANFKMEHMILLLAPNQAQQEALDELVAQQHDPRSSQYRQYLTPQQYAARFGVSQKDIDKITGWLRQHGFQVEEVTANHLSIVFSGDAYAVQDAFKTEVKLYSINGEVHHANASDPQIPAVLAGVVKGVVKLHDFHARSFSQGLRFSGDAGQTPATASSATHSLAPADWAMIYDVRPLYTGSLNGNGQSIAVVGRSNIKISDIQSFRSQAGLPANNPTVLIAQGADPGFTNNSDSTEATLDVEWAGAIAPQAQVKLVIAASTATADGMALAASYAVNHNVAPILSVSFSACEAEMGTQTAFYNALWQQAAAQGMSVFVSAGDSGVAGCESSGASSGTQKAINGICSSPYATCVGGTEFKEGSNPGQYWLAGSNPALGTAQSYIPEAVWNESGSNGGSGLAGGGGGASTQWPKPSWQMGSGVPADGRRDVPDVAVSAASHDGYSIFYKGSSATMGGTSAAAPALASLFAIVNQKYNGAQGNVNPVLYLLALKQSQNGAAVFHDIVAGNNSVPGVAGYAAGVGYDQVSGLGSVDAFQLVNHWHDVATTGTFTLTAAPAVTVQAGQDVSDSLTVAVSGGFNWPVTFSVSGMPAGVTATFSQTTLAAPGAGTSLLQFASNFTAPAGSYTVTVTATGGGVSQSKTVSLTITVLAPKCSLAASPAAASLNPGIATNVRLSCTPPQGNLPASLALSVSGQTAGISTTLSATTLVPGTGVTTLMISAAATAPAGITTLAVTASGGTFSQTINLPVTVAIPPTFSVTLGSSSVSVAQAATAPVAITVADLGTFSSQIGFSVIGLPIGLSATFAPATLAAPGAGTSTLTLQASSATPTGTYTISVVTSGGGLVKQLPMVVTVTAAPSFTLSAAQSALSIQAGQATAALALTVKNLTGNFSAPITLSVAGLPVGVTGVFSSPTLAAPGSGTSTLTLTALSTTTPGTSKITITATGGTVTQYASIQLAVISIPGFTLKTDVTSLLLTAGATFSTTVSVVAQSSFNSPVTLTVGTLPAGVTAALSSTTISSPNSTATLTIQTPATLANGTYSISLAGTSSVITTALPGQTATMQLTIGSVQTALSAAAVTVKRGASGSVTVTDTATNFTGTVSFSAANVPPNASYTFAPTALSGSGSTLLTFFPNVNAITGTYTVNVRTAAGGTVSQTPLQVIVQ